MALLIFYLLLALVISFLCSLLEAVLLSVTPSYIEAQLEHGKKWSGRLLKVKREIDKPLAAILSLNTIAHTVGAAGVGAQAILIFQNISVGLISAILTLMILVFSELIPKTIGARYWKSLTPFATYTIGALMILLYPLVLLSQLITMLFKPSDEPTVERNEVIALAEIGRREGVFSDQEAEIITNLIKLRAFAVKHVMTPRMVMVAAPEEMTIQEFHRNESFYRFSRIPLYRDSKDQIVGFVHKHDIFSKSGKDEISASTKLKDIKRDIPMVFENQNIYNTYSFLTKTNAHIALVVEEYGGTAGIVTMEDVIETLLGLEIVDEFDKSEDMQQYARQRWKDRAQRLGINWEEDSSKSPDS